MGPAMLQRTIRSVIKHDDHDVRQGAQENVSRQILRLSPLMYPQSWHDSETADEFSPLRAEVHKCGWKRCPCERTRWVSCSSFETLKDYRGSTFHERLQNRRHSDRLPLGIVDGQAGQVLAIGELLHRALEDGGIAAPKTRSTFWPGSHPVTRARCSRSRLHAARQNVRLVVRGAEGSTRCDADD